ncbi:MAG: Beta-barrel assembly-enhancing protease [Bryobacteraceae bacterium]|nr:Beta-barrel assembly-enhancing protease [Bryobacteraceae bacterium]
MSHRFSALLAALLLAAGGALTWTARPDRDVNMSAVGELWADIFRDADSFGLQLTRVSAREEMDLGRRIAARIVRANTTVPMWEVYVNTVGQSVARHAGRKDIRYEFHVIAAPARNAFSLPGGQIFLYTGLLEQMKTEAELAGVLGHEIAHVDRRHCIERFQYRMRLRKLGLDDIGPLVQIGRSLLTVGYSQYQELEADSEGLRMSLAEGYDPNGVIDLFARLFAGSGRPRDPRTPLEEMARMAGSVLTDYFRSHPPTAERMRRLTALVRSHSGIRVYRGVENLRGKVARQRKEFPGEFIRL